MRNRLTTTIAGGLAAAALGTVALAGVGTAGAVGADGADGRHRTPVAAGVVRLDGAQETQAADTDGRGTFGYVGAKDTLCYILTAKKIEPATMAHIHTGATGVAGPIAIGLEAPTDGLSFGCIETVPDDTPNTPAVLLQSELDAIIANPAGFYVNVHNAPFPAGAIRAQLR
jgi:CHRD domain